MGYFAEKLRHQLGKAKASHRATQISDLRRLVQQVESEIGPAKTPHRLQDHHPNHAVYLAAQNMVSCLAEELSALPEMQEYRDVVGQAEDEYGSTRIRGVNCDAEGQLEVKYRGNLPKEVRDGNGSVVESANGGGRERCGTGGEAIG